MSLGGNILSVTRLKMFPFTNKIFVITGCLSSASLQRTAEPAGSFPHSILIGAHSRDRTCTLSRRFLRTVCLPIPPYGQCFGMDSVSPTRVCGWPCHSPLDSEALDRDAPELNRYRVVPSLKIRDTTQTLARMPYAFMRTRNGMRVYHWCPRKDSNPHDCSAGFKSAASAVPPLGLVTNRKGVEPLNSFEYPPRLTVVW